MNRVIGSTISCFAAFFVATGVWGFDQADVDDFNATTVMPDGVINNSGCQ